MTLASESGSPKKQGRRCLHPTPLPMFTEQFSLFLLLALFLPAARPQCHLPCQRGLCHQPACLNSWMPREAAGNSEPRPLLCGHQNCFFPRCLNRTDTVSEHSECKSSPKFHTEGTGRRKTHYMLHWTNQWKGFIDVQGQGLLPPPRQCEGTRPSVYRLCSQYANSYITMTTLFWRW